MPASGRLNEETIQEIVRRIVRVASPDKIIVFGSAARGEMGPNSDVDILVVKRGEFHQGHLTGEIYMSLIGVGQAVDVIVATPEEVERARRCPGLVVSSILGEGRVVYGD
jgi:predicted nucleotidyltransferase